jgi:hypothetical protein
MIIMITKDTKALQADLPCKAKEDASNKSHQTIDRVSMKYEFRNL